MTRTEIENIITSVLSNPLVKDDVALSAKMIGSMLFDALGRQVEEDRSVVLLDGRKMRVKGQEGPIVHFEDVNGTGAMVIGTVDSIVPRVSGGRRALAEAIDAARTPR